MRLPILLICLAAQPAMADVLVATRTLRPQTVVQATDVALREGTATGFTDPADIVGLETRVTIYEGRPVRPEDVGPPAVIERNQIVPLIYDSSILRIETEARSLARAGIGEEIRVLNLNSRNPVLGTVQSDGTVVVKGTR